GGCSFPFRILMVRGARPSSGARLPDRTSFIMIWRVFYDTDNVGAHRPCAFGEGGAGTQRVRVVDGGPRDGEVDPPATAGGAARLRRRLGLLLLWPPEQGDEEGVDRRVDAYRAGSAGRPVGHLHARGPVSR